MIEIELEKSKGIAKIVLSKPAKRNSMGPNFAEEMNACLDEIESDSEIRAVILTGSGDSFCSGGDLNEILSVEQTERVPERNMIRNFMRMALRIRHSDIPFIAAVNGPAVGGGVAMALAADMILASNKARFHMGFVRIGLSAADVGMTYFLPRNVGVAKASELLLLGEEITASEAERIGMINKVVDHEQLLAEAHKWGEKIVQGPPLGISLTKFSINKEMDMDMTTALEMETYIQSFAMRTKDHKEGLIAFGQKRVPYFKGE
jgi:enoyl-CoA hydratase/carnithine racemase